MQRLLTLLALAPLLCQADSLRRSLLDFHDARSLHFTETDAGLVAAITHQYSTLYRVEPDGTAGARLLSVVDDESVRAFDKGFLYVRPADTAADVSSMEHVRFDARSHTSKQLYAAGGEGLKLFAEPALTQDAVYVLARSQEYNPVLLRVRATGAIQWQRELDGREQVQLLPIAGGVLVRQGIPEDTERGAPARWDVTAVDDSGEVRWHRSYDRSAYVSPMAFLPPARIVMLRHSDAFTAASQVDTIDANDGSSRIETLPVPVNELRTTPHGLLFIGAMLDQPHVLLMRGDGSIAWSRRLPLHTRPGHSLLDATITRSGELWVAGDDPGPGDERRFDNPTAVLRTSALDPAPTAGCLDIDIATLAKLEQELARRSIHVGLVRQDGTRFDEAGCGRLSDTQYLQFVRELAGALGPGPLIAKPVAIYVHDEAPGYQRSHYGAVTETRCCFTPCASSGEITYRANVTAGTQLGAHLRSKVMPHLRSIAALQAQFALLTGENLHIAASPEPGVEPDRSNLLGYAGPGPSDLELFGRLENTAAAIVRDLASLPPGQLAAHRARRAQLDLTNRLLVLDERSFGERLPAVGPLTWPLHEHSRAVRQLYDPATLIEERDRLEAPPVRQ